MRAFEWDYSRDYPVRSSEPYAWSRWACLGTLVEHTKQKSLDNKVHFIVRKGSPESKVYTGKIFPLELKSLIENLKFTERDRLATYRKLTSVLLLATAVHSEWYVRSSWKFPVILCSNLCIIYRKISQIGEIDWITLVVAHVQRSLDRIICWRSILNFWLGNF